MRMVQSGSGKPDRAVVVHEAASRTPMTPRWLPLAIVIAGAVLRIIYAHGSDVRNVYDDHFHVARIMLQEKRWPRPDEGWQTYQPPLYYALSAMTYRVFAGTSELPPARAASRDEYASAKGVPCPYPWYVHARKAIQLLSTVSGISTLLVIWLALRLLFPTRIDTQSVGVALVAFLPRHIYMSGMASNDAMVYLWTTLCLYAILRAMSFRPPAELPPVSAKARKRPTQTRNPIATNSRESRSSYAWWVLAGVAAALAMWTKLYGLAMLGVLFAMLPAALLLREARTRRAHLRGCGLALVLALLLGMWPYARTWKLAGSPFASNYTLRPNNMKDQLPGKLSDVSFCSLRLGSLLARPWVHLDTVDSFWTELYGELWFDYGTSTTIYQYRPWIERTWPIWSDRSLNPRERERRGLLWDTNVVHQRMLWEGRLLIGLGIIPMALMVTGLFAVWRETGLQIAMLTVTAVFMGIATPLFQTIRQPFRSSMKATFALHAILAMSVLAGAGWLWLGRRPSLAWLRWVLAVDLVILAAVVIWHFLDLALVFPDAPSYFARRDLL